MWKLLVGVFVSSCLLGCANGNGHQDTRTRSKTIAVPLPGGGTHPITSRLAPRASGLPAEPEFKAASERLATYQWRYDLPQGTVPSNYWWTVLRSTDTRNWTILYSNVSVIPIIQTDEPMEFFRLTGRP